MFFRRESTEEQYHKGKHFVNIIKNSGSSDLLLWRHPVEDFNANSTLIVMPGERAIFVNGGQIEEVFEFGTYQLTTSNYPFISRLRNTLSGGVSAFNCVVFFIKDSSGIEMKWGTDSPIQVRDKLLGISTKLKARGQYKVQISNPMIFLSRFTGNKDSISQYELKFYFREEFLSIIKSYLSNYFQSHNGELLGIDSELLTLSNSIEPKINEILVDYGLKLQHFSVSAIDIDNDSLRNRYDNILVDNYEKLKKGQVEKEIMDLMGDDWDKLQSVNVMKEAAKNGSHLGSDIGLGLVGATAFAKLGNSMLGNTTPSDNIPYRLKQLKELFELNLITEAELNQKKNEILKEL